MSTFQAGSPNLKQRESQPRVCHVVASLNTYTGGPARSVSRLAESLSGEQVVSHLFTLDYDRLGQQVNPAGVRLHSYPATFVARNFRGWQSHAGRQLSHLAATELDLIHNHGLWMFPNLYARRSALANRLPLIISPRGMLESWSLARGRAKKALAWQLYEKKNLSSAALFHATSMAEVESIRRLGLKQPVAFISNGVDMPGLAEPPSRQVLTQLYPELDGKRWLLFLSRLHPKKGLEDLLVVWQTLSAQFPDWQLLIAGPDNTGYLEKLLSLAKTLALGERVSFTGMLEGEKKRCAFANADLFVLPTHSENFGMVVAESLAYGVPVITTKQAPWQALSTNQCGWWIDDNRQALAVSLAEAMNMPTEDRQIMGAKGYSFVENQLSWKKVASEMAAVYRWILSGEMPPDCVHF